MRSANGKHFENVIGVTDHDASNGEEFVANVLDTEKPMEIGDRVSVGGYILQYQGEDNLGRSIFTRLGQSVIETASGNTGVFR